MKRFLKCLFAMMMVVGLSACSNSEQEQEAIKVVIDSYLGNCKSGDYESADAFLSKDAGSDLEFAAVYSELDSQLESRFCIKFTHSSYTEKFICFYLL